MAPDTGLRAVFRALKTAGGLRANFQRFQFLTAPIRGRAEYVADTCLSSRGHPFRDVLERAIQAFQGLLTTNQLKGDID